MALDRATPTEGPLSGPSYATQVNEEIAALWDRVAVWVNTVGGTANAITGTITPTLGAYAQGQGYWLIPTLANTASAPTINIDGRGAKTIADADGVNLGASGLTANRLHLLIYDGTKMRLVL